MRHPRPSAPALLGTILLPLLGTLLPLLGTILLAPPVALRAQASTDLAHGSRAAGAVEKLVGFGLLDDRVFALRPFSRGEVRRLLTEARGNLDRLQTAEERRLVARIVDAVSADDLEGDVQGRAHPGLRRPTGDGQPFSEGRHPVRRHRRDRGAPPAGSLKEKLWRPDTKKPGAPR